ncbi:formyltetrahydrofolate deformylase, partial [Bosea sp. (in: a-proteobacteria)]|uniref:formyltetrahydrofolate deformylase n=1 Tax=Bosea sp. (in: a-proteobacteria) TaxID=1871050 RepID=UPI0025B92D13
MTDLAPLAPAMPGTIAVQKPARILTLSCEDRPGIVHAVSGVLYRQGCNILESAQFSDPRDGRFFMRVAFAAGERFDDAALRREFGGVAGTFRMDWDMIDAARPARVLLMVSRFGHCLNDLLFRQATGNLNIEIPAIVSNHRDFEPLAKNYGIPFHHLPVTAATKAEQEARLLEILAETEASLVVLARYMQVLSNDLCRALDGRAINIHHSFLPSFKGAKPYHQAYDRGVKLIGTDCAAIERAENRDSFEKILVDLGIPQPQGEAITDIEEGVRVAEKIGYPVLVRPSFVLGGRAMQIVANEQQLREYLKTAVEISEDKPVLVDHYIRGKELEVDAICDGVDVFVPGIMELVERTGVHSGDSISVYPTFSVSDKVKGTILSYAKKLGLGIGIIGLYNIQFIVDPKENVYIIEVNPRSSRTVPFLSKATGYSLADIATEVILGKSLKEQGIFGLYPDEKKRYYVKVPVFSFNKIKGLDAYLSPEMKSTGEAIGYDDKLNRAL